MGKPRVTFDDAYNRIKNTFEYLELLEFNGTEKEAKFLDNKYGEFFGRYRSVLTKNKFHPERAKYNKQQAIKRRNETNLKKYGSKCPIQNKEIKDKADKTNLSKYGTTTPIKNSDIKEKRKKTFIEKYGVESPLKSKEVKNKIKDTILERYGVDNISKNDSIKEKKKNTFIKNYGIDHPMKLKEFAEQNVQSRKENGFCYNIDGYTAKDIFNINNISYSYSEFTKNIKEYGIDYALLKEKHNTIIEIIIKQFLTKNNINFDIGKKINNYYYDFCINNLIIECDGLYWHSDAINKNCNYHKEKQEHYKKLGYKSLFFREDEILNKNNIVESIILAKLGHYNERIFARKTKIIELPSKKASAFFEENHLMGRGSGQCYALTYEDKIVSAIRIIKKKDYIDISRFCSALNTNVVGGLGKLLKHIIKEHNPQKIQSFVDMRYGDGHSLEKLGFVETTNNISFKWTDFKNTYHRLNFSGNSGYENGMFKIWDCGQKRFEILCT